MKEKAFRFFNFALALSILSGALVFEMTRIGRTSQATIAEVGAIANLQQSRSARIAVARTSGIEGDPQVFQDEITSKLGGSTEVIKVNANNEAQASAVAKQNECDFVLLTKLAVNGNSVRIGKALDKTNDAAEVLDRSRLPNWMRKGKDVIRDAKRTTDIARGLKNVLSIKPKDKVTFTHSLISLATSREVTRKTYNETAESEEKVVGKLVNQVVQDVVAKVVVSQAMSPTGVSEDIAPTRASPRNRPIEKTRSETSPVESDLPGAESGNMPIHRPNCSASIADIPNLRGLKLGMTEAEIRTLIAPTSKAKPAGDHISNLDGLAEITLTIRDLRRPEEFDGYKAITFRLIEGKVAELTVKYKPDAVAEKIEEFASDASENLHLPDAWETQADSATIKCQGVDVRVSTGDKTLTLTDSDAFAKRKKSRRKL